MRNSSTLNIEVDFLVPIDKEKIKSMADVDCFGKLYDITTKECNRCTLRDVCCIVFQDAVDLKATEIEDKLGSKFLDTSDITVLTDAVMYEYIHSGKTTVSELVSFCSKKANTDDKVAVTEFLKRFIKSKENIYTKDGIVWLRD